MSQSQQVQPHLRTPASTIMRSSPAKPESPHVLPSAYTRHNVSMPRNRMARRAQNLSRAAPERVFRAGRAVALILTICIIGLVLVIAVSLLIPIWNHLLGHSKPTTEKRPLTVNPHGRDTAFPINQRGLDPSLGY